MPVTVQANPQLLTWKNYKEVSARFDDPDDGSKIECYTTFGYDMPTLPLRKIEGQLALADNQLIKIFPSPKNKVVSDAKTDALLSHEQLHYDVGIITARALARDLTAIRGKDMKELKKAVDDAFALHFDTRALAIQRQYDLESAHGATAATQSAWKSRMKTCLDNPLSDKIGTLPL